jgi:parallel beta-helix repeat protein/predicted outer membrane repeat protein
MARNRTRPRVLAAVIESLETRHLLSSTIYVDHTATGSNNGTSWANAYTSLSSALNAATSGSIIDVAAGTYSPGNAATNTFSLITGVALYGGYADGGSGVRNVTANVTVLSGGGTCYHVVTSQSGSTLDGFTITGGNADGNDEGETDDVDGGGIFGIAGAPNVNDCVFTNNSASDSGGAIYNLGGSATISYSTFTSNSATNTGGAVFNANTPTTLAGCVFNGNSSVYYGGAVANELLAPLLVNCLFTANTAQFGGGIFNESSSPSIVNSTFSGNTATTSGGAMFNDLSSLPAITNSILYGDSAPAAAEFYSYSGAAPTVTYTDISGGTTGTGNINTSPLFIATNNFALQPTSPCINTGNNAAVPSGVSTDLNGKLRISGTKVDMGAYEYQTVYVDSTATGANTGLDWADAYTSLQTALGAAVAGETIDVAAGIYSPGNSAANTFQLVNGVAIYGGYAQGGSASANPSVNPTTLSGESVNYHVVTGSGTNSTAVLSGFTITGGIAFGTGTDHGGGMLINAGSPTISSCIFSANSADDGAGVYLQGGSSPTLTNCTFSDNVALAGNGGGLDIEQSSPTLSNCTFSSNLVGIGFGGAIYNDQSSPVLSNCTFNNNTASSNGQGSGGALADNAASPTLTNCTFNSNSSIQGGAIYNSGGSPNVLDCIFTSNSATTGGAIYNNQTTLLLTNSALSGNTAGNGAAIFNSQTAGTLANCTFSDNTATTKGGAVDNSNSSPTIVNSILYGDGAPTGAELYSYNSSTPAVSYCDVEGGITGTGNINCVPGFVRVPGTNGTGDTGDLDLLGTSPCIDKGNNAAIPSGVTTDLAGNARIHNSTVDIGAYEYEGTAPPAMLVIATGPSNATAGVVLSPSIIVDVDNGSGSVVTTDDSKVTLSISTGPNGAGLSGTVSVNAVNGVATFTSVILDIAGTYKLAANDGSLTGATSGTFTISPAAASQLAFVTISGTNNVGAAISPAVIVEVEDQFGNVILGNTDNITVSIATGPTNTLGGTLTEPASNGAATFANLTVNTFGTYSLQATDDTEDLTGATSNNFVVNTAGAAQLAFAARSGSATAGTTISPGFVVDVEDGGGNIITSDSSTVTLSIFSGPTGATLLGTVSLAAVNGVATFNNLTLDIAGSYRLTASDGSLAAGTSALFTVNSAAATQLVFAAHSGSATAGVAISPAFVVDVEDQFGNIVSNSDSITISLASGPGSLNGTLTVAANNGAATFSTLSANTAGAYTLHAVDGTESVTAGTSSAFTVNAAAASQLVFAAHSGNATAGVTISPAFVVDVEDQFGNIVSDSDSITLSTATGPGTLHGTLTIAAVNGVATFNSLSLNTAGTYTLHAADGTENITAGTSGALTVNPAAASQLVFAAHSGAATAGVVISPAFVVDVEDQFGNIVGNSDSITVSLASGPGSLNGTLTVAASSGVATFNSLSLDTAGTYTLHAVDGTENITTGTSGAFAVNPAAASQLVFAAHSGAATAGVVISPAFVVDVEDSFGNIVSNSDSVTVSLASGPGTLLGTLTAAASSGVATFNSLSLNTAGTYTLHAVDGTENITAGTSGALTVNAAAASQLVFAAHSGSATAGVTISPAFVVDVEDQFGNIVSNSDSITVSLASGPGSLNGTLTVAASSGVATFNSLSLDTAGTYTLHAVDGTENITAGTSGAFAVNPAAASQLVFAAHSGNATAGVTISPAFVVDVEDQFGNIVSSSDSITISTASGPGTLHGTLTVAAVSGVATFNSLSLNTAGTYTLHAVDGTENITTGTSGAFAVNPAAASQLVFAAHSGAATAGVVISPAFVVDVEDQFGNIVTNSDSITVSLASGPGTLLGTLTAAASSGVATFNDLSLNTAGTYTLHAVDGTENITAGTSGAFAVNAAAASQLVFAARSGSATAGVVISPPFVVDVEDQFGNIVSNSDSITVSLASGPGSLNGTLTVAASSGVATFNSLSLNTAGTYTLHAVDGTENIAAATSGSFTVNQSGASQLVFAARSGNATAGVTISPAFVVDVEDQFGNIISDSDSITISVATGPGSLHGTLTAAAINGVATFNSLSLNTAGVYTLHAVDGTENITAATSGSFTVNPAAASQLTFVTTPTTATAGAAISPAFVVDVEDAFGNLVANSDSIALSVASGPNANLNGTSTVQAINGVATFNNLSLNTSGTYTLHASDITENISAATSGLVAVNPAAASQLVFAARSGSAMAGLAISPAFVVDVEDQFGNIVSNSDGVTVSLASGPGTLHGTLTAQAVSGVATFNSLSLDTAGTYTLHAIDGTEDIAAATSGPLAVNPAAASQLVITAQPAGATAGVAVSPAFVVDVEDAFGNLVTSASSSVSLSISSGPSGAVLGGTATVAAVNGVATFNALALDTSGTYHLTAADGTLAQVTSGTLTVNPATAAQLAFAPHSGNATAGQISPPIVVDVEDAFGNLVVNNSNVTVSIATGPGGAVLSGTTTVAAVNGVATFGNLSLDTSGIYTLAAADGTFAAATSGTISVNAAGSVKLIFASSSSTATAGHAVSPGYVVDIEDGDGNIVTGDDSAVTLSVATGPAGAQVGGTFSVAAVNGVATFSNLVLVTAGNYTLSAADGSLTGATSGALTVSPATAAKLVFASIPAPATAGVALNPTVVVDVEDQFGNLISSNASSVTLSVATGPSGTVGEITSSGVVGGTATFANVVLDKAGSYTLSAADGTLMSATSGSFNVSAAAATALAFAANPANLTAGNTFASGIVVSAVDPFGNVDATFNSTVTLGVQSAPTGGAFTPITVTAINGVASFSGIPDFDVAGAYTLAATQTNLTGAQSAQFSVVAAAATHFVFIDQPANLTAGNTFSSGIIVDAEDQFGNFATTYNSDATLSAKLIPAGATFTPITIQSVNGVATFNTIPAFDTAGGYRLQVSQSGLTARNSLKFFVTAAAPATLTFVQEPTNSPTDSPISPAPVVEVKDRFGNVAMSDYENVTLQIESGTGTAGATLAGTTTVPLIDGEAAFSDILLNQPGTSYVLIADTSVSDLTVNSTAFNMT